MVTNNQNQAKATVDTNASKPVANTQATAKVVDTKASSTDAGTQYKANDQAWNNYDASKADYVAKQASSQASSTATTQVSQATSSVATKDARDGSTQASQASSQVAPVQKTARDAQASGVDVTVPHQDLDNAVANAKKDGVNVQQQPTQHQTVAANQTADAEKKVAEDYQNQTNVINQADAQQKTVNENNSHIGNQGDHSALDQAVDNAKKAGLTVNKTDDQNVGSDVDASHYQDVEKQISDDYANQTASINKAVSDYQAAVVEHDKEQQAADQTNPNNEEIQKLVDQIKQAGGDVVQDDAQHFTYDKADDAKTDQAAVIKSLQDYQNALNNYNKLLNQHGNGTSIQGVDTAKIKQDLVIHADPDATVDVKILQPDLVHVEHTQDIIDTNPTPNHDSKDYWVVRTNKPYGTELGNPTANPQNITKQEPGAIVVPGAFAQATYTSSDGMWTYGDQKITKIVATWSNLLDSPILNDNDKDTITPVIGINSDPSEGFWYDGSDGVTVNYQFYDENGNLIDFNGNAYLTISSLNNGKPCDDPSQSGAESTYHHETATLDSDGNALHLQGSQIGVHDGKTLYADSYDDTWPSDWDTSHGNDEYWGAGLFQVSGNNIQISYETPRQWISSGGGNYYADGNATVWVTLDTTLPKTPSKPQPVHYHLDNIDIKPVEKPTLSYHYDVSAMQKQPNISVPYHYDDITSVPNEHKDVDAGAVTGANGTSVDGKEVVKDENVTFPLTSSNLPANRTDDAKSLVITDTLDKNVKFNGWKVVDANGNDVSKDFTLKQDGQNLTFTATDDFVKSMNADKSKEFAIPTIDIYATATASGVKVNNQFKFIYNGQTWDSNVVNVTTPPTPTTDKHAHDANGGVIDQTFVKQGQPVNYIVGWDLTGDKNVVLTKDMIAKGLGIQDTIDNRLQVNMDGIKVTDGSGKEVSKDLLNITNDNGTVKVMAKDPQAFLNQYQGQKLTVSIPTTVKEDITGNIPNKATEIHFGDNPQTNEVVVYVPNSQKDVEAGTITGSNVKQSVNGKEVVKGEAITFPLTTSDLPAGRNEDIKSYVITDKLDSNFDYSSVKAFLDGKDITNEFTVKNDNGTLTLIANDDLLKAMNADKSKAFKCPVIDIYGTAKASGVTIKNQYTESIDNKNYNSNTVEVQTPPTPQPNKKVDDANGNDIDAHFVTQGQPVNFTIGFDLTNDKNVVLDSTAIAKGLDIEDTIDSRLTVNTDGIKITDAKGQTIDKSLFDITDSNNVVTVKVKDPQAFLDKYAGQMLSVMIPTTTKKDVTGDIYNTAIENHFGDKSKTNQVVVYIPAPHKDVEAGIVQGTSSTSIDGKDVVKGQSITFPLTTSALPAGRKEDIKSYVIKDTLDSNFKYDSFQAFKAGQDVTSDFVPSLTQGEDGKWTLTLTATQSLLDQMNADKSKAFDIPVVDLYGSANASGVTIKNDYQEILNGKDYTSNTVTVNTTPEEKPSKEVTNDDNQDIDNTNVEDGDMLNYKVTMDLSGLKNVTLTPDTIAKGLSIIDTLPTGVTLQQGAISVTTADGKTDLTSMFNVAVDGNKVTVAAKDPARLVREYGDQKLIVKLPTKVNAGFTGDLTNIAEQNTFGNIDKTNQVVNHVPAINPHKDVCIDLGNQNSLNGKDIKVGQIFDYTLGVQRPANYGGTTHQWSVIDHLSDKDEFTGQFQVMSTCPITLEDGTVLPTDSDISRYFNMSYDYANHTVTIAATPEFLKIANLPANKKEAFGWKAFVQCKRIGYGDVTNVFEESYNGVIRNSNTVITHTPKPAEPKKPEAKPATPAPAPVKPAPTKLAAPQPAPAKPAPASPAPAKPVANLAPAPQPEKQVTPAPKVETPAPELPQTGETTNGEALGMAEVAAGLIALSVLKRKKKDED